MFASNDECAGSMSGDVLPANRSMPDATVIPVLGYRDVDAPTSSDRKWWK